MEEQDIIRIDKNISTDEFLEIMINNPIFQEDLRIIGLVGHEKK